MKLKKKYKIILIVLLVILLLGFGISCYFLFLKKEDSDNVVKNVAKVTNQIEGYDYVLEDRDTKLFSDLFQELKENLESDNILEDAYAKSLAQLFVVDLYTIDNKVSKYDIGGLDYLYPSARDSFRAKVLDTLYKTVEDNSYGSRKQDLPVVKSVEVSDFKETTYEIQKESFLAYQVLLDFTYEKDLGYDNKGSVLLIQKDNKFYVISYESLK